ncbi:MAG: hypothetical protein PSX71_02695 [bacterium]|nr:hypothetical protein [bacterium]
MNDFRHQAESVKLARLLHTPVANLDFLDALNATELYTLREAAARHLLDEHRAFFRRIATASKLLPSALNAFISERTIGPLLCARIAGEMSPPRAMEIARHLSPLFMAATAIHLEIEKATALTAALPLPSILAVARELIAQKEFITLGSLVDRLPITIIEKVMREIHDGEALLRIAFFIEDAQRLNQLLDVLPDGRLPAIMQAAANESTDLWPHALALMSVVEPQWKQQLVTMAVDNDADMLSSMIRGVIKHDLWSTVLPLMDLMDESHRRRVINMPVLQDDAVLRRLLQAAERDNLWHFLMPLVPLMNPDLLVRTARITDELSENTLHHLVQVSHEKLLWKSLLPLIEVMGSARRSTLTLHVAEQSDVILNHLLRSVHEAGHWTLLLALIVEQTPEAQYRLLDRAKNLEPDLCAHLLVAAVAADLSDLMLQRMAELPLAEQILHRGTLLSLPTDTLERLRQRSRELGAARLLDPD